MSRKVFDNETLKAIGHRIREARGLRRQVDFAEELGVSRSVLSNYEAGRRLPDSKTLEKIADLGSLPANYILTGQKVVPDLTKPQVRTSKVNNDWAVAVALELYERLRGNYLHLEESYTRFWWANLLMRLIDHYEFLVFEIAEKNNVDLPIAARMAMREIKNASEDDLKKLVSRLESQREELEGPQ